MSEVKQVSAIVANPSMLRDNDPGQVTIGYYTLKDDVLTMTDGTGEPVRNRYGEKTTHKLQAGEAPDVIAKRLTLKIYRRIRGSDDIGFGRRLVYPKVGIA
ncbi:hypothetical protein [Bradyrhizobium sp. Ai1a-2]|uniref:hypothetical protein n=1 Tax=Bradyrhizobium sp. Ai1a-2 TaxID=196490 RepID=UPI0004135473|nr:hypothetical protein [Bradyrhizobium sp. Ai1a-2]